MAKFFVSASVSGAQFAPVSFSSRNAAYRFVAAQFSWHGGEWFVNGRCKAAEESRKAARQFYFR